MTIWLVRTKIEPFKIFSTQPEHQISKSTLVDRPVDRFLTGPVDRFFTEDFCSVFDASNEKFLKRGHGSGVKILDFGRGSQKKTHKSFAFFAKITQF